MRNLSPRESRLLLVTIGVVMVVLTLWAGRRQWRAHQSRKERLEDARSRWGLQESALSMRPEWLTELRRIRAQLPRHPVGQDIKSTLSRQVETLASRSGLTLTDRTPETEEYLESLEVYQTAIRCSWRGNHAQLKEFLTELQRLGPVLDVQSLRLRRQSADTNELTGSFTLEFVYTRVEVSPASGDAPVENAQ